MNDVILPRILSSTGTFIGRANGRDYHLIPQIAGSTACDGFELMLLEDWSERLPAVCDFLLASGFLPETVHLEKNIGVLLSAGTEKCAGEALEIFRRDIVAASRLGARLAVLHFWGGRLSDYHIDKNLPLIPLFYDIAAESGILLTIENIPCVYGTPLFMWNRIAAYYPEAKFIFDTRFGGFHNEYKKIFASPHWKNVCHMHISDFGGEMIHPILHPGNGTIDFNDLFAAMPSYPQAIAVESPVLNGNGTVDIEKLNRTVAYTRAMCEKYRK